MNERDQVADARPDTHPSGLAGWLPPAGLRLLRTRRVDDAAVTATLVDLAVRGWLRIEERPHRPRSGSGADWTVLARPAPAGDRLRPYERTLLDGVLDGADRVALSQVRRTGRRWAPGVRAGIVDDAVARGWVEPQVTGSGAGRIVARLLVGVGLGLFAATWLSFAAGFAGVRAVGLPIWGAFVGVALVMVGNVVGGVAAKRRLRLTPAGRAAAAAADADGLVRTILRGPEVTRGSVAAPDRSLPYAIALGRAREWSERLAAEGGAVSWYRGGATGTVSADSGLSGFAGSVDCGSSGWSGSGSSWSGSDGCGSGGSGWGEFGGFDGGGSGGCDSGGSGGDGGGGSC